MTEEKLKSSPHFKKHTVSKLKSFSVGFGAFFQN